MNRSWATEVVSFLRTISDPVSGCARSVPEGAFTLYGTCYAALARSYLPGSGPLPDRAYDFLTRFQDPTTGLMIGPELQNFYPTPRSMHDRQHLTLHLTCATLGACQNFGLQLQQPVYFAHQFCDQDYLRAWLERRDFRNAWLEGNNMLFIAQLLIYLRDVEAHPGAEGALDLWFEWLEDNIDPETNLWGTDGYCRHAAAVYGGYHQLLVFFHEGRSIRNPRGLVDTVLRLQHEDGGFSLSGNAGACEDVDCIDILVNLYKRVDYRRAEIRHALKRCVKHILETQNPDGGFPYKRGAAPQSHMGIPDTVAPANTSTTFATWFRIHALALCAEVVPEHLALVGIKFGFSKALSMGWHRSPESWRLAVDARQKLREGMLFIRTSSTRLERTSRRIAGGALRGLRLR